MEKSPYYALTIDLDRDKVLNIALQAAMESDKFVRSLHKHELLQCFVDMVSEIAEKTHSAGLCQDPNCKEHV